MKKPPDITGGFFIGEAIAGASKNSEFAQMQGVGKIS